MSIASSARTRIVPLMRVAVLASALLGAAISPAPAIVTSDVSGSHVVGPGSFLLGLDHHGVGRMFIMDGAPTPGICTCSLLAAGGGRFALTAAHCLSDGTTIIPTSVTVVWMTPAGSFSAVATAALGQIHVHPSYDGDVFHGFDVAILEFDAPLDPSITRYALFDPAVAPPPFPLFAPGFKAGFGTSGFGGTGDTGPFGMKRVGLNTWQSEGLGALGVTTAKGFINNDHQLTYDFDRPDGLRDAFGFYFPPLADPGYGGDEVMAAVGDSGGPTFVDFGSGPRLAGVASYRTRVIRTPPAGALVAELLGMPFPGSPDVDGIINSSWGEFGVDAAVFHPDLASFISSIVTPPCPADFDMSGGLTFTDIFDFLNAWFASSPAANFDGMGGVDFADIFAFLNAWFAGC